LLKRLELILRDLSLWIDTMCVAKFMEGMYCSQSLYFCLKMITLIDLFTNLLIFEILIDAREHGKMLKSYHYLWKNNNEKHGTKCTHHFTMVLCHPWVHRGGWRVRVASRLEFVSVVSPLGVWKALDWVSAVHRHVAEGRQQLKHKSTRSAGTGLVRGEGARCE
jgi:hypothetical protein